MKCSLKIVPYVAVLAFLALPSLRAQPSPPSAADEESEHREHRQERRDRMHERMEKLTAELNLTPEQQAKIKAVYQQTGDSLRALRDDDSLSRVDRRKKIRELRKNTREQVQALLTPEQRARMKELREKQGREDAKGGPDT